MVLNFFGGGGLVGVVTRPKEDRLSAATVVDQLLRSLRRAFRSPGALPAPKSRDRNDYPSDQARDKAGPADPALKISIMNIAPTGGIPSRYRIEVEADDRMRQDIEVISDSLAFSTDAVRGW